jgi:integrase/recombinase XerD
MSNAGIPLRVIQEISGHRNLEQLQKYLEVSDEQILGAAASLSMLSPVARSGVEIDIDEKVEISHRGGCINIAQVDK